MIFFDRTDAGSVTVSACAWSQISQGDRANAEKGAWLRRKRPCLPFASLIHYIATKTSPICPGQTFPSVPSSQSSHPARDAFLPEPQQTVRDRIGCERLHSHAAGPSLRLRPGRQDGMRIDLFVAPGCPGCPAAREVIESFARTTPGVQNRRPPAKWRPCLIPHTNPLCPMTWTGTFAGCEPSFLLRIRKPGLEGAQGRNPAC